MAEKMKRYVVMFTTEPGTGTQLPRLYSITNDDKVLWPAGLPFPAAKKQALAALLGLQDLTKRSVKALRSLKREGVTVAPTGASTRPA